MKKTTLIAYTLVVLTIGAMVGGAVNAWAAARAARVQFGNNQVGIYYESDTSIVLQAYEQLRFAGTQNLGGSRIRVLLK